MNVVTDSLEVPVAVSDAEILAAYDESFAAARQRFKGACREIGVETSEWPIGQGGDTLFLAHLGPQNAARKLIVLSGLHGIEGICGSAAQVTFLQRYASVRLDSHVVLVHIVNPSGARHFRRTTETNVDLNRNVVSDHAAPAKVDAASRAIGRLFSDRRLASLPRLVWTCFVLFRLQWLGGMEKMRSTLVGGQFFDRGAPFFGGTEPAAEVETLFRALEHMLAPLSENHMIFFDLHSGVGSFGECRLLANDGSVVRAEEVFGTSVLAGHDGPGAVYPVHGDLVRGLKAKLNIHEACAVTFECGTGPALGTILALRDANSAQIHFPNDSRRVRKAKARMERAFCPKSETWRVRYVRYAHSFLDRALLHLATEGTPNV